MKKNLNKLTCSRWLLIDTIHRTVLLICVSRYEFLIALENSVSKITRDLLLMRNSEWKNIQINLSNDMSPIDFVTLFLLIIILFYSYSSLPSRVYVCLIKFNNNFSQICLTRFEFLIFLSHFAHDTHRYGCDLLP